jgi:flagellar hook-basal body complex protein FliE
LIINNLIGQASAMQGSGAGSIAKPTAAETTKKFGEFLTDAIESVDSQEKNVHQMTDKFIIGQADVSEVMIASQQAELSLQLTTQVRNKVIEAYQEIMRMQV